MPVEHTTVVNITCDNPDCPGTDLDPTDRKDWFFVSSEFYGQPVQQHVFCSNACAGTAATNPNVEFGEKVKETPMPSPPVPDEKPKP